MHLVDHLSSSPYSAVLGFAFFSYAIAAVRKRNSPLDKIPTVGPSGVLTSWIGAMRSFRHGPLMIQEGSEKYPIFKIPTFSSWLLVVAGPELLEDMRKASDEQISFLAALDASVQFDHTISPRLRADDAHIRVIRGVMTKNIGARYPDVLDEMNKTLESLLAGADKDWLHLTAFPSALQIVSRLSARFFSGPVLSSNPKYTEIMEKFAVHVVKDGGMLSLLPGWLRPFVSRIQFDTEGNIREIEEYLRPILAERLERGDMENPDADSNDLITWLWNAAPEAQRTLHDIAIRIIWLNVAAIRTTSAILTHVLFDLAIYKSYIEPLREEISTIVEAEGWNKVSIEKMKKLDSFMKESQRVHGSDAVMSDRLAVSDFTFSDGTFIPKGTRFAVAGHAINHDKRIYSNPYEFQGFRYVDMDPSKWQLASLSLEFMGFGIGKRACPGRFFAATELKTAVARILLDYDIKLTDEKAGRPKDFLGMFMEPGAKAKFSFKRRVPIK
ncbi:hypothetical protein D9756_009061 [Leucocoprinus leucothites]|uniref:Cytochrome P450 n=1 Tax=Leucocoprinus leucothites TaxID=201217 RepID=A0A8H5FV39_9AGAR|nr:hypothetical protein D9756_009061 [Leucoagaricus leucothites]